MVSETFPSSVQAVAFESQDPKQPERNLLAVGLEDGSLYIFGFTVSLEGAEVCVSSWHLLWKATEYQDHCSATLRLAWQRPKDSSRLLLASAGEDHAVHIYNVNV